MHLSCSDWRRAPLPPSGVPIHGFRPSFPVVPPLPAPCHITNMAKKRLKRPRDPIEHTKLIGDIATSQVEDEVDDGYGCWCDRQDLGD